MSREQLDLFPPRKSHDGVARVQHTVYVFLRTALRKKAGSGTGRFRRLSGVLDALIEEQYSDLPSREVVPAVTVECSHCRFDTHEFLPRISRDACNSYTVDQLAAHSTRMIDFCVQYEFPEDNETKEEKGEDAAAETAKALYHTPVPLPRLSISNPQTYHEQLLVYRSLPSAHRATLFRFFRP